MCYLEDLLKDTGVSLPENIDRRDLEQKMALERMQRLLNFTPVVNHRTYFLIMALGYPLLTYKYNIRGQQLNIYKNRVEKVAANPDYFIHFAALSALYSIDDNFYWSFCFGIDAIMHKGIPKNEAYRQETEVLLHFLKELK